MTVLVTGARGLVGSHVIETLREAGRPMRAFEGDVADPDAWRRATPGVTGIVHAAALVVRPVEFADYERVNVGGTRLAVQAARAAGARLVHVSSVAVYGRTEAYAAGPDAVSEDFPFQPIPEHDFYARSKRMAEELVRDEAARGDLSVAVIRPNVIYGERDRTFTSRLIRVVRRGVFPQIGPGTNLLSCIYAGNVAAAIVAAVGANRPGFRAYNVTADAEPRLTQREFIAAFAEALGVRLRRVPVPLALVRLGVRAWTRWRRLMNPRRYAGLGGAAVGFMIGENPFVAARAQQELGWAPPFDTRTAIRRTVTWYRAPGVD
jgi:nucleoside-diphosphate-sugar epimerase